MGNTINKKANVGSEVGLYFEPEAIHIMVPGKLKKNLISELKVMRTIIMHNINKWLLVPYLLWMVIFIIIPVILLVYFSFIDIHGHFSFTNYEQVFSTRYLKMFIDSIWYAALITMITLIISYPAAYFIFIQDFKIYCLCC